MKKINVFFSILFCVIFTAGCEDNRNNDLPESVIYLAKSGFQEEFLYKTGEDHLTNVGIVQSGLYGNETSVRLQVNEAILDEYEAAFGVNYTILPPQYYTLIKTECTLSKEQKSTSFQIKFKTEAIEADNLTDVVLPLDIENDGVCEINKEKQQLILIPQVKEALIALERTGIENHNLNPRSGNLIEILIPVKTCFNNKWDFDFSFDTSADMLDLWNDLNNTDYQIAPAESFQLKGRTAFEKGKDHQTVRMVIDRTKLPYGEFAIPVVLNATSMFKIDDERNFLVLRILNIQDKLDRSKWSFVSCSSVQGSNPVELMIDEDITTFWHNQYSPTPVPAMPYSIVIDLGSSCTVSSVDISRRTDKFFNDLKSGYLEFSTDKENWVKATSFVFP
ncbi:MAG: DUF1735 domain-containing protein, partial [Bacteroidales bacterium]